MLVRRSKPNLTATCAPDRRNGPTVQKNASSAVGERAQQHFGHRPCSLDRRRARDDAVVKQAGRD